MSRKRNVCFGFSEPSSEFVTLANFKIPQIPLLIGTFPFKMSADQVLARALNRTDAENCIVVREVCN